MNFSPYLANKLLGHTLLGSVYTVPTTKYLGLASSIAPDLSSYTELAGLGYARQVTVFGAPVFEEVKNTNAVAIGPATTPWLPAPFAMIFDAASGGNLLYWVEMEVPAAIGNGQSFEAAIADLIVELN